MEEDKQQLQEEKSSQVKEEPNQGEDPKIEKLTIADLEALPKNAGGWGWDFSVLSDLQKAVEEISRNNPYIHGSGFMDLLTSQQENHNLETNLFDEDEAIFSTQCTDERSLNKDKSKERRERREWSHIEDVVLISAWLNTSKDDVVANDQKCNPFWSRIAAYYAASPKLAGVEKRYPTHCKQRWQKINNQVCKFVGSYEAAAKQKSSGQNDDDVMKLAYQIFFNDYKMKFTLEHAWRELHHDQKWCRSSYTKDNETSKRRKCDDQSAVIKLCVS